MMGQWTLSTQPLPQLPSVTVGFELSAVAQAGTVTAARAAAHNRDRDQPPRLTQVGRLTRSPASDP
jgi:hypothetical protein